MKSKFFVIVLTSLFLLSVTGCGMLENKSINNAAEAEEATGSEEIGEIGETEEIAEVTEEPENGATDATATASLATPQSLSEEELQWFSDYFNDSQNNGFLVHQYETPEDVDLQQVFWCVDTKAEITEEEALAVTEGEGFYVDALKIPTDFIHSFIMEKMGIDSETIHNQLSDSMYHEEYDAYYFQRGDSNYKSIFCIDGTKDANGFYTLFFTTYYNDGVWKITLLKDGENYLFKSNISLSIRENTLKIKEFEKHKNEYAQVSSQNFVFYYKEDIGEVVCATEISGLRTLYFRNGICYCITLSDDGNMVCPTESYFAEIGAEVCQEFPPME